MPDSGGTITILSGDCGRYPQVWADLQRLELPGPVQWDVRYPGCGIAKARNAALREAKGEWLWFVDDDQAVPPQTLVRLLAREVPVVGALYLTRRYPFGPVMTDAPHEQGVRPFYRLTPERRGLMAVEAVGTGGMLIRRAVWEAIPPPWFTLGQPEDGPPDGFAEDLSFCRRVRAAGIEIYCDLDDPLGHRLQAVVTPVWRGDHWVTEVTVDRLVVGVPPA